MRFDPIFYQFNQNMKTTFSGIYVNCKENVCIYEVGIVVLFTHSDYCPTVFEQCMNLIENGQYSICHFNRIQNIQIEQAIH